MVEEAGPMQKRYKILITGSSGMLGVDLCQELGEDHEVYGVDVARRSYLVARKFYKADITKKREIAAVIKEVKPAIVIHAAAWTDVDGCELDEKKAYAINAEGAKNVALACKTFGAILIYISTDFVFDGKKKKPYRENDKTGPLSVYGDSKLKGEEAIKSTIDRYFILRTSWLYGKHGKNFVDTIVTKSKEDNALEVVDDQIGSPTYTKDLARAIHVLVNAIETSPPRRDISAGRGNQKPVTRKNVYGIYHVSNSGSVSWYEYAKEILRLTGSNTEVMPTSSRELNRPAKRPAMSVLDNAKFVKFTGYKMRHWKEALGEYLEKPETRNQ